MIIDVIDMIIDIIIGIIYSFDIIDSIFFKYV